MLCHCLHWQMSSIADDHGAVHRSCNLLWLWPSLLLVTVLSVMYSFVGNLIFLRRLCCHDTYCECLSKLLAHTVFHLLNLLKKATVFAGPSQAAGYGAQPEGAVHATVAGCKRGGDCCRRVCPKRCSCCSETGQPYACLAMSYHLTWSTNCRHVHAMMSNLKSLSKCSRASLCTSDV